MGLLIHGFSLSFVGNALKFQLNEHYTKAPSRWDEGMGGSVTFNLERLGIHRPFSTLCL